MIDFICGDIYFRGSVGADAFDLFLKKTLEDVRVDTSYMKLLEKQDTTLEIDLD